MKRDVTPRRWMTVYLTVGTLTGLVVGGTVGVSVAHAPRARVVRAPAASLEASLGKPEQPNVDGGTVNSGLAGFVCQVWQPADGTRRLLWMRCEK